MILARHAILTCGALLLAVVPAVSRAEDPAGFDPAPREGLLLLNNGETIQGRITRAGDYFIVVVANGELRLKAASVEFVCDNLQEGYLRKRAGIRLNTAQEHLRLGEWCQRHGLIDEARRELAEAESKQPTHPLIAVLRRRLEIACHQPPKTATPATPVKTVSTEELDRLVRTMPPGSVETFAQSIQPILVNHCTTSGCHGPQSESGFQLRKSPAGRPPGRRVTQRNLHATLKWVDRANPEASPLLTVPLRPHGTAEAPIFSQKQIAQYQRIGWWVFGLAQGTGQAHPSRVEPHGGHLSQAMPPGADPSEGPSASSRVVQAAALELGSEPIEGSNTEPGDDGERRPSDAGRGRYEPPHRSQPTRGNPDPGFKPADPFDPAIFNRRHHPSK